MSLVCTNFNKQYKQLQHFRNHYLKMIRLVINNADKMTFEQILTYHELEENINQLDKNIQEFSAKLLGLKKKDQIDESDYKMIKTFKDLLPFMISYYNHIPNIKNQNDDLIKSDLSD